MKDERVEEIREKVKNIVWIEATPIPTDEAQRALFEQAKLRADEVMRCFDLVTNHLLQKLDEANNLIETQNSQISDQVITIQELEEDNFEIAFVKEMGGKEYIKKLEAIADEAVEVANQVGMNTYPELNKALIAAGKIEESK